MADEYKVVGVCFQVTSKCNLRCHICFAQLNKYKSQPYIDNLKIIDKINEFGIKKINFTGGEPLTYKYIRKLAEYAKNLGIKTALSTNGILLGKDDIGNFDEISVSMDGANQEITNLHRTTECEYEMVKKALSLSMLSPGKFDIATVVSKKNIKYLRDILYVVKEYPIRKWKLFQYSSLIQEKNNLETFSIDKNDFLLSINRIKDYINKNKLYIDVDYRCSTTEAMMSYITILPDGYIALSDNNHYKVIMDILSIDSKHEFYKVLELNNFNFNVHNNRHFRDK